MSEEMDWTERVNRLTANTVHEALAKMIEEARVAIGISHDALEERVVGLDERMVEVQTTLTAALAGARDTIDAGLKGALDEIPNLIARARDEAQSRATAETSAIAAEMRSAFAESMERVQQQFAVQSEHLLEEVTSMVQAIDERLEAVTGEVEQLRRALEEKPEAAAPAEPPAETTAEPAARAPVEPYRFAQPAGTPTSPSFTISLPDEAATDDGGRVEDESPSIWS